MKKICRMFAALCMVAALLPAVAYAGTSNGSPAYASTGSKDYVTYSRILTSSTHAIAYQFTRCTSSSTAPGEMGSQARLYRSNGTLYGSSQWRYTGSTYGQNVTHSASYTLQASRGTSWYAQGSAIFVSGGDYRTITSYRTLNQTVE